MPSAKQSGNQWLYDGILNLQGVPGLSASLKGNIPVALGALSKYPKLLYTSGDASKLIGMEGDLLDTIRGWDWMGKKCGGALAPTHDEEETEKEEDSEDSDVIDLTQPSPKRSRSSPALPQGGRFEEKDDEKDDEEEDEEDEDDGIEIVKEGVKKPAPALQPQRSLAASAAAAAAGGGGGGGGGGGDGSSGLVRSSSLQRQTLLAFPPKASLPPRIDAGGGMRGGGGSAAAAAAVGAGAGAAAGPPPPDDDTHFSCPCCGRRSTAKCVEGCEEEDVGGLVWSPSPPFPPISTLSTCPYASSHPGHVCAMNSDDWEVVTVLDNREVRTQQDRTYIQGRLMALGVAVDTKSMPLGDFTWIVRRREGRGAPPPLPDRKSVV